MNYEDIIIAIGWIAVCAALSILLISGFIG